MRLLFTILGVLVCFSLGAQQGDSRTDLEKRRQQIMESIRQTEAELAATRQNKQATMSQLRALQAKLNERQRLVNNISNEINAINNSILVSTQEVGSLKKNLELLKIRYAQSIRYAYSNRSSYNMLAFLFSASDFNDAARRAKYLKKYRDFRKDQVAQIYNTQDQIQKKISALNSEKAQKDLLYKEQEEQKRVIQSETNETNDVVNQLKGKENDLAAQIEKNRKATRQLDKTINEMIRREIEIARKKAQEEQRKKEEEERRKIAAANASNPPMRIGTRDENNPPPPATTTATTPATVKPTTTTTPATTKPVETAPVAATATERPARTESRPVNLSLTPEAAALANSFESNRGRLPWPVEKGFVSGRFGVHPHPVERKVMVENNGVTIRTSEGATARAVFEGTVANVFSIPGAGWNILITHGNYFTVYSGLASTRVKKGDHVSTKQAIGTVGKDDEGDNVINFQIWKGASKMDPEGWIAR
ncbi:MAG: peptidoglycan DD-metalloendopeptidase family protein [Flavipsychrobacter sp.]|nr:peptidoglycan DD-metalloendopeptidase family protein [Flavipsychrobacter sp.]